MSELSETTGVTVPTLKYYLREGLLHAGEYTSPNQARYDGSHVDRVRLVRALIDVGGLPVARAAEVVSAMQNPALPLSGVFGIAQRAVTESTRRLVHSDAPTGDGGPTAGQRLVAELCAARGWHVHANNPGLAMAARVLDTYSELGQDRLLDVLDSYADAAELIATADLAAVADAGRSGELTDMANVVIVGTVLGDALVAGLRRIAQEAESFRRFPTPGGSAAHSAGDGGHYPKDPTC